MRSFLYLFVLVATNEPATAYETNNDTNNYRSSATWTRLVCLARIPGCTVLSFCEAIEAATYARILLTFTFENQARAFFL